MSIASLSTSNGRGIRPVIEASEGLSASDAARLLHTFDSNLYDHIAYEQVDYFQGTNTVMILIQNSPYFDSGETESRVLMIDNVTLSSAHRLKRALGITAPIAIHL